LHADRFVDKAPATVYATLLDEGTYHCLIRTMYRILHDNNEVRERRNQLRRPHYTKPELLATAANQVWSWDITKFLGPEKWTYFHLYVILDIYSRYAVGWMLAHRESADLAQRLIRETIEKQDVNADQLTIHSDRGPSMKSHGVAQLLASLGVTKSHSRPHVSNDNPFSESQFKTMNYRPEFPNRFGGYDDAMAFCRPFFTWYNDEHYHSGIGLLTPAMLHYGQAIKVIEQRQQVLASAYTVHPERFVQGRPTPPRQPEAVWINPPKTLRNDGVQNENGFQRSMIPRSPWCHWRTLGLAIPRRVASPQSPTPFHQTIFKLTIQRSFNNTHWTPEPCLNKSRGSGGWPSMNRQKSNQPKCFDTNFKRSLSQSC